MIASLLLAATLAASPDAAREQRAATATSPLDRKITLELKDASLKDTLEKLAVLLDATPIIEPGIDGKVTVSLREMPVSKVIAFLEAAGHARIWFSESPRRLVVSRAAKVSAASPELVSKSLVTTSVFGFRTAGRPASWHRLGPFLAPVALPGCAPEVGLLRSDEGGRVVFLDADRNPRIVSPASGTFRLPGCADPFTLEAAPEGVTPEAVERPRREPAFLMYTLRVLEVTRDGEEVLSAPKVMAPVGESFQVRSGSAPSPQGDGPLAHELSIMGLTLAADEKEALLALSVSVDREVERGKGLVRAAQSDQSLRLALGRPERVTLSSTWGAGKSALVAEISVARLERKR